jgi:tRNA (guanine-N7-)-methyltransferase
MGRRALPKIDAAVELSSHWFRLDQLPSPGDFTAMFSRSAPVEVEVGSGKGLFLAAAASQDPEANYLGIEIADKYSRFAASRLSKRQLANARMVNGDAQRIFREWMPTDSLRAVHVYFPDPWWKARHRKRRVMNEAFLKQVERVLLPGATLHFWTDVQEYFQTTLELIPTTTHLAGPFPVEEKPADHDLDYRTHFERRMRMHGKPIYRAEFRKPISPPA